MKAPVLSIVLIVYNMPRQAMNTLYSLSADYQRNVDPADYEVIVVENRSANTLNADAIAQLNGQFRYVLRDESGISPAPAINAGAAMCRGHTLGLMVDGARMLSPRVLSYVLMALRVDAHSLIAVPGYNLGPDEQQFHHLHAYDEAREQTLLEQIRWRDNGYRLFDIANLSGANPRGALELFLECNCLFAARDAFAAIGGADERFNLAGGGSLNLHLFRALGVHPLHRHYFVLPGEGSFHQFHGGVTTSYSAERDALLASFREQLNAIWHGEFGGAVKREPLLLGAVTSQAQRFLHQSSRDTQARFQRLAGKQTPFWLDDLALANHSDQHP